MPKELRLSRRFNEQVYDIGLPFYRPIPWIHWVESRLFVGIIRILGSEIIERLGRGIKRDTLWKEFGRRQFARLLANVFQDLLANVLEHLFFPGVGEAIDRFLESGREMLIEHLMDALNCPVNPRLLVIQQWSNLACGIHPGRSSGLHHYACIFQHFFFGDCPELLAKGVTQPRKGSTPDKEQRLEEAGKNRLRNSAVEA